ncbi:hypothetical protein QDW14_10335 [Corynebacterium bovis]|uniref:hypothetical protein n=1 Tax=Corynebacterium bovis TaxID=36808 RepID=UPI002448934A|nr:hypothetical protein [Corynebacterium bovis]MDH2456859.1 hypothetical protein [Corynebacterium bovis]
MTAAGRPGAPRAAAGDGAWPVSPGQPGQPGAPQAAVPPVPPVPPVADPEGRYRPAPVGAHRTRNALLLTAGVLAALLVPVAVRAANGPVPETYPSFSEAMTSQGLDPGPTPLTLDALDDLCTLPRDTPMPGVVSAECGGVDLDLTTMSGVDDPAGSTRRALRAVGRSRDAFADVPVQDVSADAVRADPSLDGAVDAVWETRPVLIRTAGSDLDPGGTPGGPGLPGGAPGGPAAVPGAAVPGAARAVGAGTSGATGTGATGATGGADVDERILLARSYIPQGGDTMYTFQVRVPVSLTGYAGVAGARVIMNTLLEGVTVDDGE